MPHADCHGAALSRTAAEATFPGTNGRIFFRQGKNIYSVTVEGTGKTLIAKGASFPGKPRLLDVSLSPNGRKIAFSAAGDIWVKVIGAGARNVTIKPAARTLASPPAQDFRDDTRAGALGGVSG